MAPPHDPSRAATRTPAEERFLQWLHENGARFPKIEWPVVTPNGLRGATAREDIATGEVMVSIPQQLMISEATCWADATLRRVYADNRDLFARDDPVLALFLVHEMTKQEASFYFPYLSILPEVETVQDWTADELAELKDASLVDAAARRVTEMTAFYSKIMRRLGDKYPGQFPPQEYTFARFRFAWKTIQARTFGRRLPWTSLVPFADCLNHANVATKYDFDVEESSTFRLFPSATTQYKKGTEVFNSYGRRPNFQLLLDYGFALDHNEWDYVDLALPRDTTQRIGKRFPFRKRLRIESSMTLDALFPMQQFPHDEGEEGAAASTAGAMSRQDVLLWFRELLVDALASFGTTRAQDEELLVQLDSNKDGDGAGSERLRKAVVYRLGRLRILEKLMCDLDKELLRGHQDRIHGSKQQQDQENEEVEEEDVARVGARMEAVRIE